MGNIEQRRYKRRAFSSTAYIVASEEKLVEVHTVDISLGGVSIAVNVNPKIGARFTLRMTLPVRANDNYSYEVRVQVMHSLYSHDLNAFRVGLKFLNLPERAKKVIDKLVSPPAPPPI